MFQSKIAGLRAELPGLQELKCVSLAMAEVSAGSESFYRVNDKVDVIELCAARFKKVGRNASGGRS